MTQTSDYISTRWRAYAVRVNRKRAIPSRADGLKESQRIGLWIMKDVSGKKKTVGVAGRMAESLLYVHGDDSAQDAISSLAAPYMNNLPLLQKHGNFGTLLKPRGWADARYTEVSKPSYLDNILFTDIDIVPMEDNYDGSTKMPSHFLPLIPLVLLNGQKGMGVGFASNIFPRAFVNVVKATQLAIEGKKIPPELLVPIYTPNNNNTGSFVEYTSDNKPRWQFRGKLTITNSSTVVVTELPSVDKYILENYREFLDGLIEKGTIADYDDHSSKTIKVVVKFPRGALKDKTEDDVMQLLGLVKTGVENIVMVGEDGFSLPNYQYVPDHQYPDPVERFIREWVEWRFTFFETRYLRSLDIAQKELNYLEVLKACFDHKLPDTFLKVANRTELKEQIDKIALKCKLITNNEINDRITNRASYSWTKESYAKILNDIDVQKEQIDYFQELVDSPDKRRGVFRVEVAELLKIKLS